MLKPKCMPNSENPTGLYYSAEGYILPCCYLDTINQQTVQQLTELGIFDQELKLSNVPDIETILDSPQWKNFIEILLNKPECAPDKCKSICKK